MNLRKHRVRDSWLFAFVVVFGSIFAFTAYGMYWYWFIAQPQMVERKPTQGPIPETPNGL